MDTRHKLREPLTPGAVVLIGVLILDLLIVGTAFLVSVVSLLL